MTAPLIKAHQPSLPEPAVGSLHHAGLSLLLPSSLTGPCVCVQIEAALSQLPRGGGKVSLQARLDEVRGFSRSHLHLPHSGRCGLTLLLFSSSGGLRESTGASDPRTGRHQNDSEEVPRPPLLRQHIAKSVSLVFYSALIVSLCHKHLHRVFIRFTLGYFYMSERYYDL